VSIQRAVVLVGSAKPAGTSTSEALGQYLCARLQKHGVDTTVLFVSRSLKSLAARALAAALAEADLFVLTTPVYIDSLPYLVTRTLEDLARSARPRRSPCAFAAIVNCGFPEAGQCRTALDILHAFARRARFNWAGGLALGEGGVVDGQSLEALGGLTRHVRTALDRAAAELAEGRAVPAAAVEQVARRLIPPRVYTFMGNLGWRRRAMRNRVTSTLNAKPFELEGGAR
jgi:hypothetical protein